MCFADWRTYNKVFRPASTKKQPFLLKKLPKKAFFRPEMVFFWPWVVTCSPPCPALRVLDSKRHLSINWRPYNKVFRPASTGKQPFLLKKMPKMAFFRPEMVFFGPAHSPAALPAQFSGC